MSYEKEVQRLIDLYNSVTDEEVNACIIDDDSDYSDVDNIEIQNNKILDNNLEQSDVEADEVVQMENNETYVSEQRCVATEEIVMQGLNLLGTDGVTRWAKHPLVRKNSRTKKHNLVTQLPGPVRNAKNVTNILETWQLFFPDMMLEKIVLYTNIKIKSVKENYSRSRDALETDIVELRALFGLLYLAGVHQSSHQNILDLWKQEYFD